jgi:hypothetical protein
MASYAFAIPIRPEMVERDRELAKELNGPRKAEFAASRARAGITSERVWVQQTPQGTLAVVVLEGDDIGRALGVIASSQDPFDVWWRAQILEIHGVDLSQPPAGPMNEQLMDYHG